MKSNNIFEYVLEIIKAIRRPIDIPTKIALAFLWAGCGLLAGGTISLIYDSFSVTASSNDGGIIVTLLGFILIIISAYLGHNRVQAILADEAIKDRVFFYIPGFSNSQPDIDLNEQGLDKVDIKKMMTPIKNPPFDSRIKEVANRELEHLRGILTRRASYNGATKAFIKSLSSVPFLFQLGALFRDNHIDIHFIESIHGTTKGYLLNKPRLTTKDIALSFNGEDKVENGVVNLTPNDAGEVGLALSMTQVIHKEQLPMELREHTLMVNSNHTESLLIENQEQLDELVEVISKAVSHLSSKATVVNLFLCAQTSMIFGLGKRYQEGMHGLVRVHQYCSKSNEYIWSLDIT